MKPLMSHSTLFRVFLRPLISRIILCCAVLCALLEVLALLEEASVILSRHLGISGLLKFMLLHFPTLATEILPLSVMIGALFTLLQMTLSSEVSVLRAAGLSTFGIYKYLLPAPLLIGIMSILVQFWIVPPCEQELNRWWNETATLNNDQNALHGTWFRSGADIIQIDKITSSGKNLEGVSFYRRHPKTGLLTHSQFIANLHYVNHIWESTNDNLQISINPQQTRAHVTPDEEKISLHATPHQIMNMTLDGTYYTPNQIFQMLKGNSPASLPRSNYLMALCAILFTPIQMAVMLLITLPITYIPPRAGLRNPLPVYVMAAGLGIVILQGMISALGNAGSLPVLLAVSAGQIIGALLSLTWVLRMEEK